MLVLIYPYLSRPGIESKASLAAQETPVGVDSVGLAQVMEALERNHAALKTITFSTEETCIEHPVAAMTRYMIGTEEAKQAYLRAGDKTGRYKCEYAYREEEIRVDCKCLQSPNGPADAAANHDMLLVGSKGRRVHYLSGMGQAFLTTMKTTVDEHDGWTVDFRCAGFSPPLKSVADWLRQHEVLAAGMVKAADGRPVFQVRVLEKRRVPRYVTATFEPAFNYLPSRIIHWFYPSGGILQVTDIRYSPLANGRGWFPEAIRTRAFLRDTNDDPDAPTGQNVTREIRITNLNVDSRIPDETFDPILASGTRLRGNLAGTGQVGDQPLRASSRTRSEPRQLTRPADPAAVEHARTWAFWPIALAVNGVALGLGFVFRKRFAF
jgi:hypothetical protein